MEPRGAIGHYDPKEDRYTLYADVQYPHRVRDVLAGRIFRKPTHDFRVVTGDVGGAFGIQGLAIYRTSPNALGITPDRTSRQMDL